ESAPMSTPLQAFPAPSRLVGAEHVVMAGAALALVVLVALPLAFLVGGSLTGDDGLTLAHFRDAVTSRLHVQALRNSLVLGAATAGGGPPWRSPDLWWRRPSCRGRSWPS